MAGIYIHIPFCNSFCTYCSFYSVKGKTYRQKYIQALKNEVSARKDFFKDTGVSPNTLYIGGGTPSVLPEQDIAEIINFVTDEFHIKPIETSIEVNPNDISLGYAKQLKDCSINRISMGIQSFVNEHLQWMNRRHNAAEAINAYYTLQEAGFTNISLDLIFGYELLTNKIWEYNLNKIIELRPQHISSYQMSIEPASALQNLVRQGKYTPTADSICNQQYKMLQDTLKANGYVQYEISNFALKDSNSNILKSKHNSSYWTKEPYIGLGPAAHSYNGLKRSWNNPSITRYCNYYNNPQSDNEAECGKPAVWGEEILTEKDVFNESIMLGLRTTDGVNLKDLNEKYLNIILPQIKHQILAGNIIRQDNIIKIPSNKLFVSDGIIRDLFI